MDYQATVATAPDGARCTVTITGDMTIAYAERIKDDLMQGLAAAPELHLDIRGVEEMDLIGLQFVCSLHRSATAQGKRLLVTGTQAASVHAARCAAGFQEKARCSTELNGSCVWCAGKR